VRSTVTRAALTFAGVALLVLALVSEGGLAATAPSPLALLVTPDETPPATLIRVDPTTLRPLAETGTGLVQFGTPALSPDTSQLVFGSDVVAALSFVGIVPLRAPGDSLFLSRSLDRVVAIAWPRRRLVLALAGHSPMGGPCCAKLTLFVVDPVARRVLRSYRFSGVVESVEAGPGGLAVLLGGFGRIIPAWLAVFDANGSERMIRLDRIRAGFTRQGQAEKVAAPALAFDLTLGRAFVVAADGIADDGTVAEVSLARASVTYHHVPVSLVSPNGGLVLLPDGRLGIASLSALLIVDTHTWNTNTSVPIQAAGWIAGEALLAPKPDNGLDVYNLDGSLRLQVTTPAHVLGVQIVGTRAFLSYQQRSDYGVLDLRTGELRALTGAPPELILGGRGVAIVASAD
jgi:hypothetical protein